MSGEYPPTLAPTFDYTSFDLPENVSLTFHLGHHYRAADLPDSFALASTLRGADIVIPEFVHDASAKDVMRPIAMGRQKEYQKFRTDIEDNDMGGWLQAFASSLYASRTDTANIDVHFGHPSVGGFNRTEPPVRHAAAWPVRERFDDILPLLEANLDAIKCRDQAILENIAPEIEAVVANSPKLANKREDQPLDVHIFYGALHTSLFDAITFQQQSKSIAGFAVRKSLNSVEDELSQKSYANFVRDQDILVEDVERHFAYLIFASHIQKRGLLNDQMSISTLQDIFITLENRLDLSVPRSIPAQIDDELRFGSALNMV